MENHIRQFMEDMGLDSLEDIGFLYQDYINECDAMVHDISTIINTADIKTLEKLIHNLKGVSANLYVHPVYQLAEALDTHLKSHANLRTADQQTKLYWDQLSSTYEKATSEILLFFNTNDVAITR